MTQVQKISQEGLKHSFTIIVPNDVISQKWQDKLKEFGQSAKMDGFRPGKVPMPVLEQRFGASARAEVLDEAVSTATEKTLTDNKLRPAMQPKIEMVSMAEGKDVEFRLDVEVLPDVPSVDFASISLEKPVADVPEAAIDEAITRAAKALRQPVDAADGHKAAMGDVLVIDFDGRVDGQSREGMKGEGHRLELGTKSFIDTFEDQLVGMTKGESKLVKVTFPAEYHAAELSGKAAEFDVVVQNILVPKPVTMDDAMAKDLGFDSMTALRDKVREGISENYARMSRNVVKRGLMDQLADKVSFELPPSMVDAEFNNIWQQVEQAKKSNQMAKEDEGKSDDELRKEYRAISERRIRLGLLLADVATQQKLQVTTEELRSALMQEAQRFPGQERAVFDYYTKTEGAMDRLRAPILEEKTVDYVLGITKVNEKKVGHEELIKMNADDEDGDE